MKQTIRLNEWETAIISEYDNTILKELFELQRRNIIKTGISDKGILITANSNVGLEVNQSFNLIIEPKISGISMIKMIGFLHGFIPTNEEQIALLGSGESSFKDSLIYQWVDLVDKLSSKIRKKYIPVQNRENYVKGKILTKELAKQGILSTRTPIEYQVLDFNQPLNQVIKAGLIYFKRESNNPVIVNKINLLLRNYVSVSDVSLSTNFVEKILARLTRLEEVYKVPLEYLSWLLAIIGMAEGKQVGKSLWVNMNALFQNYLTKIFNVYVPDYRFMSEISNRTIFQYENHYNPFNKGSVSIRPDLMVFQGNKLTHIIDFKYKDLIDNNVSTSDLYQLSNYGLSIGEGKINPIILYPSTTNIPNQKIRVNIPLLENKQQIILRAVNLIDLEELIDKGNYAEVSKFASKILENNMLKSF